MKSGKILILFMTQFGSLTESLKSLYKRLKALKDLKTQFVLQKKEERLVLESLGGTLTSNKTEYLSKGFKLNLRLGEYLARLKSKAKGHRGHLPRYTENLFGVVILDLGILTLGLLHLLYQIVNYLGMCLQASSLGLQMYLQSSLQKVRSYVRTKN